MRRRTLREYLNITVAPTWLIRRVARDTFLIMSVESLVKSMIRCAKAFAVEGFLALGTGIGVGLVAVLVKAG